MKCAVDYFWYRYGERLKKTAEEDDPELIVAMLSELKDEIVIFEADVETAIDELRRCIDNEEKKREI